MNYPPHLNSYAMSYMNGLRGPQMTPSTQKRAQSHTFIIKHMKSSTRESTLVYCVHRGPEIPKMNKISPTKLAFI